MKTRMISAVMAAFMLAVASVGGITASAEEGTAETTETTASEPADESSDDMEKFREVMSELAEAETTDVVPDYDGDLDPFVIGYHRWATGNADAEGSDA